MTTTGTRTLLADGLVAIVRDLDRSDASAVRGLHQRLTPRDSHLRFLSSPPRRWEPIVSSIVDAGAGRSVGAFRHDRLVGVAHYVPLPDSTDAEVAVVVDSADHAHGVGTLLLERLASTARDNGIRHFVAYVSAENSPMLQVLRDLGLPYEFGPPGPERDVRVRLHADGGYLDSVVERERHAQVASLSPILRPRSVAVIGAGRRRESVGHAVLAKLAAADFTGQVCAVNPHASSIAGAPCYPTVTACPVPPELAVICVPAHAIAQVVDECGAAGVQHIVIMTAGITGTPTAGQVLAAVRRHGMRLVGPNGIGIVNTEPGVRLDASFLAGGIPAGDIGVVTQSGGVAIAVVEVLRTLGTGVSTLVSTGDKYDVSSNDLLLWWLDDPRTAAVVLYIESFGNPRKFGRIARTIARQKPVLAVRSASTQGGQRAASSHTAATTTPTTSRDALFRHAGVTAVDTLSELTGLLAVISWQPLPAGFRVAVVGNAGGIGVVTADACERHGLTLATLSPDTTSRLRDLLPPTAAIGNPVDTTAIVSAEAFTRCLDLLLADDGVDMVIAEPLPTAVADPVGSIASAPADTAKPLVAVRAGHLATAEPVENVNGDRITPCFGDPELAAATLARLARYSAWLATPPGHHPPLSQVRADHARTVARSWLEQRAEGGWADHATVAQLMRDFDIPLVDAQIAVDRDAAGRAAAGIAGPVAMKAVVDGLLHKSAGGGVLLGLTGTAEAHTGYDRLHGRFGDELRAVLLQPMISGGRELLAGIVNDATFGPLVVFGLGGTDTDVVDDRASALAPLTEAEAGRLISSLRSSTRVFSGADTTAIVALLVRLSRLADAVPEIEELDLNPVNFRDGQCQVVDARIRLAPRVDGPEFLRALQG